jgi:hypothetical protein
VDGSILGANVRIGEKAVIQGSELGSGSEIEADGKFLLSSGSERKLADR